MNGARFDLCPEAMSISRALRTNLDITMGTRHIEHDLNMLRHFPDVREVNGRWLNGPPRNWLDAWWNPGLYAKSTAHQRERNPYAGSPMPWALTHKDWVDQYGPLRWKSVLHHAAYWLKWSPARLDHCCAMGEH